MKKYMLLGMATVLLAVAPQLAGAAPASNLLGIQVTDIRLAQYGYGGGYGYHRPRYYYNPRPYYGGGYGGYGGGHGYY
jgi:hypothetical protein